MRYFVTFGLLLLLVFACGTPQQTLEVSEREKEMFNAKEQDTVTIASENPENEWEIIIIEPGFNFWLQSIAKPRDYYSQQFLEARNRFWTVEWNNRVLNSRENRNLYLWPIDYNPSIDYGYEVNYKLYNYLVYFQRKYNQRLGGYIPRI